MKDIPDGANKALFKTPEYQLPDASGHFGPYGGSFVAETLSHALAELNEAYARYSQDPEFLEEFRYELAHFVGRPSPVYHAKRWSQQGATGKLGAQIFFKREDLNHTGAHKINNVIGQALLAKRMGKPRIIAETGAGQHGVATATICARFGLECVVYMGSEDVKRQAQNVYRMKLLGATVVPVESGSKTLKDALNEAMRDWVTNIENTFYIIGTVAGPHPYPMMVRDFQSVIGEECRVQMPQMTGRQPDYVVACIGGGSNAMGIFYPYIDEAGREAGWRRGGGRGPRQRQARGFADGRLPRRPARQPHLPAAGCARPDHRDPFGVGRPGLPRRRPRARLAEGHRARAVRVDHRRGSAAGLPRLLPHRGHHPGAGILARDRLRGQAGAHAPE
jgi:tryptophan synthase beta chain